MKSELELETNITSSAVTTTNFHLYKSKKIADQNGTYIYDIANSGYQLAASFSDHTIKVLEPETLLVKHSWKAHSKKISDLKFNPVNQHHLISSSLDGSVCLWDLRCSLKNPTLKLTDDDSLIKPLTCFDIDFCGNYLSAGTELIYQDSYILFWDVRNVKTLGGYWNSHFDEVTQVKFHSSKQNWIISGSIDGLINLFDITKSCEDDALITTLNSECSIFKLTWLSESNKLACITNNQDLQIWDVDDSSPCQIFTKTELINFNDKESTSVDYLVDFMKLDSRVLFMCGNYSGINSLWELHEDKCQFLSILPGRKDVVLRACTWNSGNKNIVTGGEDGELSIWKENNIESYIKQEIEVNELNVEEKKIEQFQFDSLKTEVKELNIEENKDLPSDSLKAPSSLKKKCRDFKPYKTKL